MEKRNSANGVADDPKILSVLAKGMLGHLGYAGLNDFLEENAYFRVNLTKELVEEYRMFGQREGTEEPYGDFLRACNASFQPVDERNQEIVDAFYDRARLLSLFRETDREIVLLSEQYLALIDEKTARIRANCRLEENADGDVCAIFVVVNVTALFSDGRMNGENPSLDMLEITSGIPGAILVYRAYGNEEILFANEDMYRLLGCENFEDFMAYTKGSFRHVVHPEDYDRVSRTVWEQIRNGGEQIDYVKYRVVTKDGEERLVDDIGRLVHSRNNGDLFYVFLHDLNRKVQTGKTV